MEKIGDEFKTNPEKAAAKVSINSFMIGSLFMILTIIWTLNPNKFSPIVIAQLVLAIPLLFVSSLAYAKIGYWKETKWWDRFGWFTNNLGNLLVLNVVGLITSNVFQYISYMFFGLILLLMLFYSIINIHYKPSSINEKILKYLFFVIIIFLGGILPLILGS